MAQGKDVEHGIADVESVPLLPLQHLPHKSSGNGVRKKSPLNTALNMHSENKQEDVSVEENIETRRPNLGYSWLEPDQSMDTEHHESYVEDPNIKAMLDAIDCDNEEDINRLVDAGVDPNATYPLTLRQEEYLYIAVWDEDMEGYKKIPTWTRGKPMWSMLQFASAACHVGAVRRLLARGARGGRGRGRGALDVAGAAFHYGWPVLPDHFTETVSMLVNGGAACSPVVYNGTVSPLHTAARLCCARAAAALLRAGAAWSADADGLTPVHRAVELKSEDMLEVLLSHGGKETANAVSRAGESALFYAVSAQWVVGCAALLRAGASSTALCTHPEWPYVRWLSITDPAKLTPLHLAIELNNTDIVYKILTLAEQKHIDCLNSSRATPLFTAIIYVRLACVKMLLRHGASVRNIDEYQSNVLHVAALHSTPNDTSILKYLLENIDISDLINELNTWGEGPIHKAVRAGAESVKLILDKGADVRLKVEDEQYHSLFTPLHLAGSWEDADSARIILGYDRTTIDDMDAAGRTPLIVAVRNEADEVVTVIVEAGALLSTYPEGEGKQSAIEMITAKLPNPTDFFIKVFDSFLYILGSVGSTDSIVDYERPLTNEHEKDPLKLVEELVRCGQRKVLVHPLIETLLYLKWSNLFPVFLLFIGTYVIFVITLNVFVGMVFYYSDKTEKMPNSVIKLFWVDIVLLYGSICFLIMQEFICMRARGSSYWHSVETWLKLGSMALGAALPPWLLWHAARVAPTTGETNVAGTCYNAEAPSGAGAASRHAASAALLLAWLQMMLLVGRFPHWGYYVLMMAKVASNIAKILLTSVFLVLGFALSFMVQFHAAPPFDGPLAAFTKTIVMMASEFDYEDLFGKDHDTVLADAKTVVRLLFILFLLFMSVVLMNFIVGVSVNDIHTLTVTGNVRRLEKQLELLRTLETLVYDGVLGKILPAAIVSTINKRRYISKMVVNPGTTKIWTVHCANEEDNYKILLPTYLYHAAVVTTFKITDAEFTTKKVNNMVKMLYDALIKGTESIDPYVYRQHAGIKVKSKVDDVLNEMKKLNDVKEDLKKLQKFCYDDKRHRFTRRDST